MVAGAEFEPMYQFDLLAINSHIFDTRVTFRVTDPSHAAKVLLKNSRPQN